METRGKPKSEFTLKLLEMKPGDKITVSGPYKTIANARTIVSNCSKKSRKFSTTINEEGILVITKE
jgi:NAD(P)H-flavin reductase